ncbi:MAG TPA: carboxypeptidase-like regulatory domain-containing protein [Kofleriaceae bacterium]|nr:carboxypeptidase-like regulatory domain-containing protein [Kofleriaceae bacterium]
MTRHAILLACMLAACAETGVRTAPFRYRPDSADPGSLRGPFDGRVVDATTHAPIAGALVYAAWTLERGTGLLEPDGAREAVTSTDAGGNYKIAAIGALPPGARLTDFTLLIYKRGYVAYRSDRRFSDFGPRMDFAQTDNQVLLDRWNNEMSHARHLRFVGSGLQVSALTQWELADASAELEGKKPSGEDLRPGRGEGPYVVAAQLLTEADIKARTKYDGSFETGPLSDEPDTATYSSQHFKALGRPETWDVAIRLWRLTPAQAQERYDELLTQLPGITEKDELASRSFTANENDIRGIGFLDAPRGVVVLMTCGVNQCVTNEDAIVLGRGVYARLKQLLPTITAPTETPP